MRRQKQIKTILISGATGFLGSNILKRLVDQNHKVVILKRSFSNTERIDDYLKKIKYYDIDKVKLDKCFLENNIDAFIHCATDYGRKKIDPMQIIDSNLIFPLKLMEIAINNNCKIFLNTDTILDKRVNSYSLSKSQFLDWFKIYSEKAICINIVLEHFYGPFDDKSKFVASIIKKLVNNESHINFTLGEQKRDFIYIDDVVDGWVACVNDKINVNQTYNLGSGVKSFVGEMINEIIDVEGKTGTVEIEVVGGTPGDLKGCYADITKIKKQLNFEPKTSLKEGLKKFKLWADQKYSKL